MTAGSLSLLGRGRGFGLDDLARVGDRNAEPSLKRARSVIYVFLSGGLSQIDSFDMKPDGPEGIRGEFRPIATRTPGTQICEHLPLLAKQSETWALVRSLTHPYNEHSQGHLVMLTGRTPMPRGFDASRPKKTDWPSIASIARYVTEHQKRSAELPPAVVLPQLLVHRTGRVIPGQFGGQMGPHWDPFLVDAAAKCAGSYGACPDCFHHEKGEFAHSAKPVFQAPNLTLPVGLDPSRVKGRIGLLETIRAQQRRLEHFAEVQAMNRQREQAIALLSDGRVQRAFDVLKAPEKTQERYGKNQFGWSLLMARRLVEQGVRLIQVNLGNNETWDTHQAAFPNLKNFLFPAFDRSLSALLGDLGERGLLESTLVVVAGEFGRTPRIFKIPKAKLAGRDHWGAVQSVLLAGGGVRGGAVIGSSDSQGGQPATDPQKPENLAATMYEALGIPRDAHWRDPQERPYAIYHADPIPGLLA